MAYYDDYYGWKPYVPVAARRRQAAREVAKLAKKGARRLAGRHRRPQDRQDVLGQGLVRQPRALQRLREPAAARPHLRAQRLGGRSADRAGRGDRDGERLGPLSDRGEGGGRPEGPLERRLQGLRGRHRLARRAAARAILSGRDGAHLSREDRSLPVAGGDHIHVQLSGLGVDVQARRGGALRHRRPAGRAARSPVRAAQGGPAGSHHAGGQGPGADRKGPKAGKVLDAGDLSEMFGIEMASVAHGTGGTPQPAARTPAKSAAKRAAISKRMKEYWRARRSRQDKTPR